ncbi:AAA family ATPase [Cupriavidus sp. HPC(L)]|uniref:AAA family ATPase n=1 Tax=Cupriavidus sp. HPC(L) TaxID=1217418 RepID=UPI00029175F3|nr:AAA family ATPase [Cupriavidus sp. HPC(L)]
MQIKELKIENYRSLRDITFRPNDLTVVVGANGSGKSNLASAFEFLADVYRNGLEYAVLSKGGFENIAYRRQQRTKSAVQFSIDFLTQDIHLPFVKNRNQPGLFRVRHTFSFGAARTAIRADFKIVEETLQYYIPTGRQSAKDYEKFSNLFSISKKNGELSYEIGSSSRIDPDLVKYLEFISKRGKERRRGRAFDLLFRDLYFLGGPAELGDISVHQFSPQISRTPGAPSPLPRLTSYGQNLAALVDWLQRNHPQRWEQVEDSMRQIIPGLESIGVAFTPNNLLALTFKEESSAKPWTSQDVSDGTIQTLALLCCLADPRNTLLFLEEPENSVHPWIVQQLTEQFKKNSKQTQTILTTHSPVVLNMVEPGDVWICYKEDGETRISHLPEINPEVVEDWESGVARLFELFDMGLVRQAMPKGQIV